MGSAKLSVNVNKVATVRNSRGGKEPSVIQAVRTCIDAGAPGITVHPRADARHITTADVHEIAEELAPLKGRLLGEDITFTAGPTTYKGRVNGTTIEGTSTSGGQAKPWRATRA